MASSGGLARAQGRGAAGRGGGRVPAHGGLGPDACVRARYRQRVPERGGARKRRHRAGGRCATGGARARAGDAGPVRSRDGWRRGAGRAHARGNLCGRLRGRVAGRAGRFRGGLPRLLGDGAGRGAGRSRGGQHAPVERRPHRGPGTGAGRAVHEPPVRGGARVADRHGADHPVRARRAEGRGDGGRVPDLLTTSCGKIER